MQNILFHYYGFYLYLISSYYALPHLMYTLTLSQADRAKKAWKVDFPDCLFSLVFMF